MADQSQRVNFFGPEKIDPSTLDLNEEVIKLNRVAKVVKGGRRFSFTALVAVGDGKGHVGLGYGKANEVPDSIGKAVERAKKNLISVPLIGRTIPHELIGRAGAAKILLKPASEGTGILAGPAARAVIKLSGIQDILTKCLGTNNVINVAKATFNGLGNLKDAQEIAALRGKTVENILGKRAAERYYKAKEGIHITKTIEKKAGEEAPFKKHGIPPLSAPTGERQTRIGEVKPSGDTGKDTPAPAEDSNTAQPQPEPDTTSVETSSPPEESTAPEQEKETNPSA